MHYPGGKAKTFHHVVNLIPPHKVYIEPFLGLGSVMKAKKRAEIEFGVDLDERALEMSNLKDIGVRLIHDDGISFLENFPFEGHEVVYCDPPYYPKHANEIASTSLTLGSTTISAFLTWSPNSTLELSFLDTITIFIVSTLMTGTYIPIHLKPTMD